MSFSILKLLISRHIHVKKKQLYCPFQTNEECQTSCGQINQHGQDLKSEGVQAGGTLTSSKSSATSTRSKEHLQHMPKSVDYGDGNESVSNFLT